VGEKGKEIFGMEVEKLLGYLNRALADEWLVCYQYCLCLTASLGKDSSLTS